MFINQKSAKRRRAVLAAVAGAIATAPVAAQAQSTWTATTSGTWTNVANWNGGSGPAPVSSQTAALIFNGTTNYTATNNLVGGFSINTLTFANTAGTATLAGNGLDFNGGGATITTTAGGIGVINMPIANISTLKIEGSGIVYQNSNSTAVTGIVEVNGGTLISSSIGAGTFNFNPNSIVVNNGGTYQFGDSSGGDPNLPNSTYITANTGGNVIWDIGETFGGFILKGGTVTLRGGGLTLAGTALSEVQSGTIGITTAVRNIGGTVGIRKTTAGTVTVNGAALTTTGNLSIEEGVLETDGGLGTAALNGDIVLGTAAATTGTFRYTGAAGATVTTTRNLTLNNTGGTIDVANAGATLSISGTAGNADGSTGVLTKTGAGTLFLSGPLSQSSTTLVNGGTLRVNPVISTAGFNVAAGAKLAVNSGAGTATLAVPNLTLASATSTLELALNSATAPTVPLLNVTAPNGFVLGAGVIQLTNTQSIPVGTYTLVDYTGTAIGSGVNIQLPARVASTISYDTVGTKIDLTVTSVDTVKWNGSISGVWDTGTAENVGGTNNFKLSSNGNPTNFIASDVVTFDDTAAGPNFNVDIAAAVQPFSVTVNNTTQAYTFSGVGAISGVTAVTKTGTGTLTVANNNTYTGTTTISAGTVQVGAGGTTGSLGTGAVVNNGTLTFDRSDGVSFANAVSGTGTINKNNANTLTFLGSSTFTGTLNVNAGTFVLNDLGAGGDLNASLINVANGAKFLFGGPTGVNPDFPATTLIDVASGGELEFQIGEDLGAIRLKGGTLRLTGNAAGISAGLATTGTPTFAGLAVESGTVLAANVGTGTGAITGNAANPLTKTTAGTLTFTGRVSVAAAMPINLREGTLVVDVVNYPTPAAGDTATPAAMTLGGATTAASIQMSGTGAVTSARPLIIGAGGGTLEISDAAATVTQTGAVSGSGTFTKTGAGTLTWTPAATFTGQTVISAGKLRVSAGTAGGSYTLGSGVSMTGTYGTTAASVIVPALTLNSGGNTLAFELTGAANPTVPLLNVTGNNALNLAGGAHTLTLTSTGSLTNGTFSLIAYNGNAIPSGFSLVSTLPGRAIGTLAYNSLSATSHSINVVISGSDTTKWAGTISSDWDLGTAPNVGGTNNFALTSNSTGTNFVAGDNVTFDDTALGTARTVNLTTNLAPAAVTVNSATTYTFQGTGSIAGSSSLVKQGAGTLIVNTNNTNTGTTTVSAGTLQIGAGGTTGAIGTGAVINNGAIVVDRSGTTTIGPISGTGTLTVNAGATLTLNSASNSTYAGTINGDGVLTKAGTGTLTLTGNSTFTGGMTINAGTVQVGSNGTVGTIAGSVAIAAGTLTFNRSNDVAFAGNLSGVGTLSKVGAGKLTLAGDVSSYRGATTVTAGSLEISTPSPAFPSAITLGANPLLINQATSLTMSGAISGTGIITKSGVGAVRLTGPSTGFTGTININAGSLVLTDELGSGGDINATSIVVNAGGNFTFGNNPPFSGENPDLPDPTFITINTGGTVTWNVGENFGGMAIKGGAVTAGQNMAWTNGVTASLFESGTLSASPLTNPAVTGAAAVEKKTAGVLTIDGLALNNTGGVSIQEGTLATNFDLSPSGSLSFGTATTSGTLKYYGSTRTLNKPIVTTGLGGTIEVTDPAATYTYSSFTSGNGSLTKTGPGILALVNSNTHTGGTTVSAGTLQIGNGSNTGSLAGDIVNNATVAFNRTDEYTFGGAISGTGAVSKQGSNTVNLTGALSYNGPTTIDSGTLRVTPFTGGAMTVGGGATLAVSNVAVPGTLTLSSLALNSTGSTIRLELDSAGNPTAPLINVTGTNGINLNGGAHTINVFNKQALSVGTVTLIDYTGNPISSGFTLTGLPARIFSSLVYNTVDTKIDLNITGVDSTIWSGALSSDWDNGTGIDVGGTKNWKPASNTTLTTNFVTNDQVLFDDTANGTGPVTVNLVQSVLPFLVTVNNPTRNYTFQGDGLISGTTSLTKLGNGSLTLANSNNYTGGTTINAGTVTVGTGGTVGGIGSGAIVNNGTLVFNRSDDLNFDSNISGTGSFTKLGNNLLTVNGLYTLSGTTTISGGKLALGSAGSYNFDGTTAGTGTLEKLGDGVLTVTNTLAHTGGTNISVGTLRIGNGGTTGSVTGNITIASATLAFNRTDTTTLTGNINVTGTGVIAAVLGNTTMTNLKSFPSGVMSVAAGATLGIQNDGYDLTTDAAFTGVGTAVKSGSGLLTLTGTSNGFAGTFVVNGGTVRLTDDVGGGGGDLNAASIIVNNTGKFEFFGSDNPDLPDTTVFTANAGGTVEVTEGENYGGLNLNGGAFTSNVNNNFAGGVTSVWQSGTVSGIGTAVGSIGSGGAIQKTTAGTVTVTDATINLTGGIAIENGVLSTNTAITNSTITFGTTGVGATKGTLQYRGATATLATPVVLNTGGGVIDVSIAGTIYTVSNVVSGAGGIAKDGPGTLVLSNVANTYTGATEFKGGALRVNTLANLGTGDGGLVFSGGTLLANAALTFPATGGTPTRVVTLTPATTGTVDTAAFNVAFQQNVTGGGSIAKTGTGTLTLSGTNTYTGGTSVAGGTLVSTTSLASSVGPMSVSNTGSRLEAPKIAPSSLAIDAGASVKLTNVDTFGNLTGRSTVGTLNNLGLFDIGATGVVIANATESVIRIQLQTARAEVAGSATWSGSTGITSSAAQADPSRRAVGYSVAGPQITLAYAILGDASLDGTVNITDLGLLAQNYSQSNRNWGTGDFNYDGVVNISDLGLLAQNYSQSLTAGGGGGAFDPSAYSAQFQLDFRAAFDAAAVPEPTSIAALALAGVGLLARRRRR
ncbi:autotransporter-associated beta strand repeat-containing protein [Humisphaera borealis]|uniref:Autotransporter-associated beta strand repeat-containing protein n=1 Tax=Humisphaera borealis TaxID=2807512 RepID=A0A7M2WXW2_9BACT|nr:autotransporter-associated beta strand repeat-containing protein [Humisphaera borealis]QOV90316.1 autotransporter-associated beta strand repeat-containing protein [Humisphaera borealis]